ncbi:adenylate kinase 8-like [Copidosoma floridanum]|uniref:adenylate kinase 8-like n=1 Tax=Copidosoma floridanum TaxID=29053 RepID=UPI000C6F6CBD|nr:adenylate kinase 8-like [Copidosoma floridanum]
MQTAARNPLKFVSYLEKHRIYELFQELSTMLVIKKPEDHLLFLKQSLHHAARRLDVPRIIILSQPGCDKLQLAGTLREQLQIPLITLNDITCYIASGNGSIIDNLRIILMNYMSSNYDGWILVDFPRNEKEARELLRAGLVPTHVIEIDGTRVGCDSSAKFHHHREIKGIRRVFTKSFFMETVNMNEPIDKVTAQCLNSFDRRNYSRAPTTLRILLIDFANGETFECLGSSIAKDFNVTFIDFSQILEQTSLQENSLGDELRKLKLETDSDGLPSRVKTKVFEHFLLQSGDLAEGWLLTNFVSNVEDFKNLDLTDFPPNRIIIVANGVTDNQSDTTLISNSATICTCDDTINLQSQIKEYAGKTGFVVESRDDPKLVEEQIQSYLVLPPPCVPPRTPRAQPDIESEDAEFDPDDQPGVEALQCLRRPEPMLPLI